MSKIGDEILDLMGGKRYLVTVGARDFRPVQCGVKFNLPKGRIVSVDMVEGTFTMVLYQSLPGMDPREVGSQKGLLGADLIHAFDQLVGTHTNL